MFVTLTAQREGSALQARVNKDVLAAIVSAVKEAAEGAGLAPPTLDGILAIRGVVEVVESGDDETALAAACAGALQTLDQGISALTAMRRAEGAALSAILRDRLAVIVALTQAADENPARRPEAIALRLAQSVAALLEAGRGFDENRLYQEAVLLAAKADIREELDRLKTHVEAARELIANGGPVGRRLDFLAQELAREANTLCAKVNDATLTSIGLDLRAQIEQLREQIQNIECEQTHDAAARPDPDPVLAVRRRQDDADPHAAAGQIARPHVVGLGDDARAALERSGRHPLSFHHAARIRGDAAGGRPAGMADVHGHRYGTPRAPVEAVLAQGRDMLFDIDWQGAQQVRKSLGEDVVSVFILPPSMAELRARLDRRAEDSSATIAARLDNARREIERWRQYDYVIVNDDLQRAYGQVVSIIVAERLREPRLAAGVEDFVKRLLEG